MAGIGRGKSRTKLAVALSAALLVGATALAGPSVASPGDRGGLLPGVTTLAVSPVDHLLDGQQVTVTGTGLIPGQPFTLEECAAVVAGSSDCDASTAVHGTINTNGNYTTTTSIRAAIATPNQGSIGCNEQGNCSIAAWEDNTQFDSIAYQDIGVTDAPVEGGQPPPAQPTVLFVSPTGTGTACTQTAPCSLVDAQRTAETLVPAMQADIEVRLGDGVYSLTEPLTFGPRDGGVNGFHVVYESAPGAHPVLSGARTLTGWKRGPTAGVWQAPVGFDTRQLYVDGQRLPLSSGLPANTSFIQTSTGYLMTSTVMDSWPDP